ncbi:MAG: hypothetical protein QOH47_2431 [Sphingomonadales bacterium]|jgi:hypothetical protein|nr:hypothetical protein [Sphingomonadales bacterium]
MPEPQFRQYLQGADWDGRSAGVTLGSDTDIQREVFNFGRDGIRLWVDGRVAQIMTLTVIPDGGLQISLREVPLWAMAPPSRE